MTGMHKAQREVPAPTQRLFLTRREAAIELRMSLAKLDRVIARGELTAKKHGHSVVVMARSRAISSNGPTYNRAPFVARGED